MEDFSGYFFPTKMRRKNPARNSAKIIRRLKKKIREKSVLPKAGPKPKAVRLRMLVAKGTFAGSLRVTLENENPFKVRKGTKGFLRKEGGLGHTKAHPFVIWAL